MKYSVQKRAEIINKYFRNVNMSARELKEWSETDLSKKASLDRRPINRNLKLLSTPIEEWIPRYYVWASKTNSYLARARKIPRSKIEIDDGYTRNEIAMKNWAYDIKKTKR
jgi:hypothetical protein